MNGIQFGYHCALRCLKNFIQQTAILRICIVRGDPASFESCRIANISPGRSVPSRYIRSNFEDIRDWAAHSIISNRSTVPELRMQVEKSSFLPPLPAPGLAAPTELRPSTIPLSPPELPKPFLSSLE